MPKFDIPDIEKRTFTGRQRELKWLDEHLFRRNNSFIPLVVHGPAGVGKTALVRYWLSTKRYSGSPLWLNTSDYNKDKLRNLIEEDRHTHLESSLIVIIDADSPWNDQQYENVTREVFNYKAVSSLIFISRHSVNLKRYDELNLQPLDELDSIDLAFNLAPNLALELSVEDFTDAAVASKGYPLALTLLLSLIRKDGAGSISDLLRQPLYELSGNILVPQKEILTVVPPIIFSANQRLVDSLKKQPADLHKLTPRNFEKLLAELLADMGWEVELTKQTRDGGTDILAYLNTDIGRLLCLVEAKHYRPDRKIGIDLVRTLYGTLCDAQANSAMLVTSSTFTADAREFQQKHQYQLTLRDYADIVNWILKYGNKRVS